MSDYGAASAGPLFDAVEADKAKRTGAAVAAENKRSLLEHARRVAEQLPNARVGITADDVVLALAQMNISVHALGNAAGSLFAERKWQWTGERRKSTRVHSHGNELKVWRLVQ